MKSKYYIFIRIIKTIFIINNDYETILARQPLSSFSRPLLTSNHLVTAGSDDCWLLTGQWRAVYSPRVSAAALFSFKHVVPSRPIPSSCSLAHSNTHGTQKYVTQANMCVYNILISFINTSVVCLKWCTIQWCCAYIVIIITSTWCLMLVSPGFPLLDGNFEKKSFSFQSIYNYITIKNLYHRTSTYNAMCKYMSIIYT